MDNTARNFIRRVVFVGGWRMKFLITIMKDWSHRLINVERREILNE